MVWSEVKATASVAFSSRSRKGFLRYPILLLGREQYMCDPTVDHKGHCSGGPILLNDQDTSRLSHACVSILAHDVVVDLTAKADEQLHVPRDAAKVEVPPRSGTDLDAALRASEDWHILHMTASPSTAASSFVSQSGLACAAAMHEAQ